MLPANLRKLLGALALASLALTSHADEPAIAAAADLRFALADIAVAFRADTGRTVRISYGSSGDFARQIEQGAPFELYFSADESFVRRLTERGLTRDEGALYGIGRLVLFTPPDSPLQPDPQLAGLRTLLARDTGPWRLAIANPEHAPYGRAAEEVLRALDLWEAVRPRLVLGENVSQAAQFAVTGNSVGGLIAYALALAPELAGRGSFVLLPEELHQPLRQRMVLLKNAGPTATLFYDYLRQDTARAILDRYGFLLPAAD